MGSSLHLGMRFFARAQKYGASVQKKEGDCKLVKLSTMSDLWSKENEFTTMSGCALFV